MPFIRGLKVAFWSDQFGTIFEGVITDGQEICTYGQPPHTHVTFQDTTGCTRGIWLTEDEMTILDKEIPTQPRSLHDIFKHIFN